MDISFHLSYGHCFYFCMSYYLVSLSRLEFDLYYQSIFLELLGIVLYWVCLWPKWFDAFQVMNNMKVSSHYISVRMLILFSGVISLVNITLLVLLDTITGSPDPVVVFSRADKLYSYVKCRVPDQTFETVMIAIIFGLDLGLLTAVAAILAIYTRRLRGPFGENRFYWICSKTLCMPHAVACIRLFSLFSFLF